MNEFMAVIKNYAGFSGRAGRREYWMFYLVYMIIYVALTVGSVVLPSVFGILTIVFALALFVPSLAVAVRRLHDSDRSGWWLLILFVPLIGFFWFLYLMIVEGTPESNRFGESPVGQIANAV
jgi:uncharacterized membrane protein YhaH (DUF805 family)